MAEGSNHFRIIIIGAGASGLLTAQYLKKVQDIHCTVFESDASPEVRPRDWDYGIYWAQVPLDECLPEELSRQVESCQVDNRTPSPDDYMPIYNGQTAELMKNLPAPYNIRLRRRKFLELLRQGIDIRFGKRLAHVGSDGTLATVVFEDGTREQANLVIGAEGAHSKVREFLVGAEKSKLTMSPLVASMAIAQLPAETALEFKKLHPRYTITFHPNGYFTWVGIHAGYDEQKPGEWTFLIANTWASDHDTTTFQGLKILEDIKERAKLYGEPFKSIMLSIPEGTRCWHNRLSYWITEPWDNRNGTITLVGDAAHSMTFHRGQGLNNAIHDAASLSREIQKVNLASNPTQEKVKQALKAYEEEMWPRGKEAVVGSNDNSLSTHNWSTLLQSPLFTAGLKQKLVPEEPKGEEVKEDGKKG